MLGGSLKVILLTVWGNQHHILMTWWIELLTWNLKFIRPKLRWKPLWNKNEIMNRSRSGTRERPKNPSKDHDFGVTKGCIILETTLDKVFRKYSFRHGFDVLRGCYQNSKNRSKSQYSIPHFNKRYFMSPKDSCDSSRLK